MPDVWQAGWVTNQVSPYYNFVPGDFNGDGRDDLIVTYSSGLWLFCALPQGGFDVVSSDAELDDYPALSTGDFNFDGTTDALITTHASHRYYFGTNTTIVPATGWFNGGYGSSGWTAGDYNGDGRTEFIRTSNEGSRLVYAPTTVNGVPTLGALISGQWGYWTGFF